ncbi:MAG: hypothetical protein PWR13_1305 [Archaeoglobi archaeon]|nr:DUF2178 domain-containing protein [Candidatus Mnemosynella bozhongmuii]MDI3502178.1 hypothetical protein [Archaeoglobi archaeon]MDK2782277.1 hypothetical protein [Archaeoglobi archaeon]
MDRKRYALLSAAVLALIGGAVGYAVLKNQPLVALLSLISGIILLKFLRRRVGEVLEDERVIRISERASRRTLQVFAISAALLSALLIATGKYRVEGSILGFAVCGILILYLIFYAVYSRSEIS